MIDERMTGLMDRSDIADLELDAPCRSAENGPTSQDDRMSRGGSAYLAERLRALEGFSAG